MSHVFKISKEYGVWSHVTKEISTRFFGGEFHKKGHFLFDGIWQATSGNEKKETKAILGGSIISVKDVTMYPF